MKEIVKNVKYHRTVNIRRDNKICVELKIRKNLISKYEDIIGKC